MFCRSIWRRFKWCNYSAVWISILFLTFLRSIAR
jgi:hypothetical protein